MTHADILGSRPMDLDTETRRKQREIEIAARIISALILSALAFGMWRVFS